MAMIRKTLDEVRRDAEARPKRALPKPEADAVRKAAESDPDTWLPNEHELRRFKSWRNRAGVATAKEFSESGASYEDEKD